MLTLSPRSQYSCFVSNNNNKHRKQVVCCRAWLDVSPLCDVTRLFPFFQRNVAMYLTVYTRQPSNGAVSTSLPTSDEQGAARFFFRDSRHVIPVRQPYCSLQQIGRSSGTVCQIVTRVGSFADQQIKFSQSGALYVPRPTLTCRIEQVFQHKPYHPLSLSGQRVPKAAHSTRYAR